ncbi:MAG: hypothetical protein L6R41_000905 [Letrouitia leprolyta]|nr:MAG: hypothetical protein L6R41_000905 [Letrouitia leprolyta]
MAEDPTFFTLKSFLHLPASEADRLIGRIVKNFREPWAGSAPKDVSKIIEGYIEGYNRDFKLEKQTAKGLSLKMRLQGLLGINLVGTFDSRLDLEGKKIMFKLIRDPDLMFDRLKADPEVQRRVPSWIKVFGPPVCLITGLLMYEDTIVSSEQVDDHDASLEGKVPVTQLASGVPIPVGNVKIEGGISHVDRDFFQGYGEDRKIFALQLKLVTTGFIHNERLRLKDRAPKIPDGRQLAGGTDDVDEESDEDSSGPESVGSKKQQLRRKAEMEIMNQIKTLPIGADDWDTIYNV